MRLPLGSSRFKSKKTIDDIEGFKYRNRFIVLSKITSNSIPDIIDVIFNLNPAGTGSFLDNSIGKTKVTLLNVSQVYGDAHGNSDYRTRNVYIHHGYIDSDIDKINGESLITFVDLDYNVIPDKLSDTRDKLNITQVKTSYDASVTSGSILYRDNSDYKKILIPTPNFYDEKDMLLVGDHDEDYMDLLNDNKEEKYFNFDKYYHNLFRSSINELMDNNTKVIKLMVNIEVIGQINMNIDDLENLIQNIAAETKCSLESCGFSGAEVIYGGNHMGFNVEKLKSCMDLSLTEKQIGLSLLYGRLEEINSRFCDYDNTANFTIFMNMNYSNVNVRIVQTEETVGDKTDITPESLTELLKIEQTGCVGYWG